MGRVATGGVALSTVSMVEIRRNLYNSRGGPTPAPVIPNGYLYRCLDARNLDPMFIVGTLWYFVEQRLVEGVELLKKGEDMGSDEAKYLLGLIVSCTEGGQHEEGIARLAFF